MRRIFCFNAQRGYCVHYATVATIMYRLYGVPARYVCGYRLSAEDFKETDQSTYVAEVSDKKCTRGRKYLLIIMAGFL